MEFSAQSSTAQPQFSAPTSASSAPGTGRSGEGGSSGDGTADRPERYTVERVFERPTEDTGQAPDADQEKGTAPTAADAPSSESDADEGARPIAEIPAPAPEAPIHEDGPIQLGIWTDESDAFGFVDAVAERLPERYEVRTFHTSRGEIEDQARYDLDQVDMVWYEWGDPKPLALADFTSSTPTLVRLHPAVIQAEGWRKARWDHLDHLFFPTPATQKYFLKTHRNRLPDELTGAVLTPALDLSQIPFDADRPRTQNVALYAPIGPADSPALIIQILDALLAADERYHIHIAGPLQDPGMASYIRMHVDARGITDHVHFYGAVTDEERGRWLDQCSYVLSTRLVDGDWSGVIEGMARGLKPVVHHLPGADELFPPDQLFTRVDEAVEMLTGDVQPVRYRRFAERRYGIEDRVETLVGLLDRLAANYYPERMGNYFQAWRATQRPEAEASPETVLAEVRRLYEEGDHRAAAERLRALDIEALPEEDRAEIRLLALRVTVEAEAYTDALFHADAALDAMPEEPIVLHLMGTALWAEGHREAGAEALVYAAELLETAEEEDAPVRAIDDAGEVYYLAGEVCEQFGEASAARHFFECAQRHAPDEPAVASALKRVQPQTAF